MCKEKQGNSLNLKSKHCVAIVAIWVDMDNKVGRYSQELNMSDHICRQLLQFLIIQYLYRCLAWVPNPTQIGNINFMIFVLHYLFLIM